MLQKTTKRSFHTDFTTDRTLLAWVRENSVADKRAVDAFHGGNEIFHESHAPLLRVLRTYRKAILSLVARWCDDWRGRMARLPLKLPEPKRTCYVINHERMSSPKRVGRGLLLLTERGGGLTKRIYTFRPKRFWWFFEGYVVGIGSVAPWEGMSKSKPLLYTKCPLHLT